MKNEMKGEYMAALLIAAGMALIIFNIKAVLKENKSFDKVFKNKNDDMREYEVEIGKLRKEFGETIFEIQSDIEDLKDRIDSISEKELQYNKLQESSYKENAENTHENEEKEKRRK